MDSVMVARKIGSVIQSGGKYIQSLQPVAFAEIN